MKVSLADKKRADRFIALIKAFKSGKQIQKKGILTQGEWTDIDLGKYMSKSAVCYRVKP